MRHASQVRFSCHVIECVEFTQHKADLLREPKISHVRVQNAQREARTTSLLAGEPAHHRGEIHAKHFDAPGSEEKCSRACATRQVASRIQARQNIG